MDKEKLWKCREVDLFYLLPKFDPGGWKPLGQNQIQGVVHDSCIVTRGKGWTWFSRHMASRNPVDFLMEYYDCSFKEAVGILADEAGSFGIQPAQPAGCIAERKRAKRPWKFAPKPWICLYSYLCNKRCISPDIVDDLVAEGLVYETAGYYRNICFINTERTHWEVCGVTKKKFKRISDAGEYWKFVSGPGKCCYISESAIDAISLYELLGREPATYISIGGSASRKTLIGKIFAEYEQAVLAVDNDEAGDLTASLFPGARRILPAQKDFNEDLVAKKLGGTIWRKNFIQ